jgi:ketosteroid isomerase-like protein
MESLTQDFEQFVRDYYAALNRKDLARADIAWAEDVQAVSEASGDWVRNREELIASVHEEVEGAERFLSKIDDLEIRMVGDRVGIATFIWHGDLRFGGRDMSVRCPTTIVGERSNDGWRIVTFHSTPLERRRRTEA